MANHCVSACQAIVSHQAVTPCHTALLEAYAPCGAVHLHHSPLQGLHSSLPLLAFNVALLPPLTVEVVFLLL